MDNLKIQLVISLCWLENVYGSAGKCQVSDGNRNHLCREMGISSLPFSLHQTQLTPLVMNHKLNRLAGNSGKFNMLVQAYEVLSHPEQRAAYDLKYDTERALQNEVFEEALPLEGVDADRRIQQGILSLLYVTRRRNASRSGMGIMQLERLLGCAEQHMEFHIWYLKEKGRIERTETGEFAITAEGIDSAADQDMLLRKDRLLPPGRECSNENKNSEGETINCLVGTPQFGIDAA
jgi:hypothetical protein